MTREAAILPASFWWLLPAAAVLSAFAVCVLIGYAERRGLIDTPGARRSHRLPTPRGGGLGIVAAILVCGGGPLLLVTRGPERVQAIAVVAGTIATALIGWSDDHRPLAAWPRLAVHLAAAAALAWSLQSPFSGYHTTGWAVVVVALVIASTAWSINLHNFMDGIDGLLAGQAIFVFAAFAALAGARDGWPLAWFCLVALAATAGFLPFNAPRARVFMGDVGSGALGFLIAAAAWIGIAEGLIRPGEALIATSAFVTDAGWTLLSRILRGRRWYSAHREHLYQWLARSRRSHPAAVAGFAVWNLAVVVPALIASRIAGSPGIAPALVVSVYTLASLLWWFGKRQCLSYIRNQLPSHRLA